MPQHPAFAEGRTAVITGGASGIGLAAAKRFAAFGMKICLADLSQEALDRAAEQLSVASVLTVPTDVSKMEEVQRLTGCGKSRSVVLPARFVAFCPFVTR